VLTYDLVWDNGDPNTPVNTRLVDTVANFHLLRDLGPDRKYRVAVRAHNKCGYGEFSEVATVDVREKPGKMSMLRTGMA